MIKRYLAGGFLALILGILGWKAWKYYANPDYAWWKEQKEIVAASLENATQEKVLFITTDLSRTGAPMMVLRLARMLKKRGFGVAVMYQTIDELKDDLTAAGIPVVQAQPDEKNYAYFRPFGKMFDLIVINGENQLPAYVWTQKVRPSVVWLHEYITSVRNLGYYYEQNTTKKSGGELRKEDILQDARVVTVSNLVRSLLKPYLHRRVNLVYNGVEESEYTRSQEPEGEAAELYSRLLEQKRQTQKTVFLHVGSIIERKGTDILVEAVKSLPPSYQEKAVFYLIGWSGDEWAQKLQAETADMPGIVWRGVLPRADLDAYYRTADALLVPSRVDPAPCVVTEAAMFGVPAVITSMVGSTYLIKDEESGFVIPVNDAAQLRDKIMYMIDHPEETKKMGEAAQKYFAETSREDIFVKKWIKIIRDIVYDGK